MEVSFKLGSHSGGRHPWKVLLAVLAAAAMTAAAVATAVLAIMGNGDAASTAGAILFFVALGCIPAWVAHRVGRQEPRITELEERLDRQDEKLDLILERLGGNPILRFPNRNG